MKDLQYITHAQIPIVRDRLLKEQENICPICGGLVDSPNLDHKHAYKTRYNPKIDGFVRKVLCRGCNRFVGMIETGHPRCSLEYQNLPAVLRRVADFLENQPYTNIIHPKEKTKIKKHTT